MDPCPQLGRYELDAAAGRCRNPINLGAPLTADAVKKNLPAGAKLWVNLPPSQELAAKVKPAGAYSAVQVRGQFVGRALRAHRRSDGERSRLRVVSQERAGGWTARAQCARHTVPAAPPLRNTQCAPTGYRSAARTPSTPAVRKLNNYASLLAKVNGWLELANSPADASTRRVLFAGADSLLRQRAASGRSGRAPGRSAQDGLAVDDRVIDHRWVYVLDIDCHGQGTVLYPRDYSENQFPNDADNGRQFILPGAPVLRIGPPYGVDTLILLSTEQPLADPYVLNFEGVASRGTRGVASPLEKLLNQTSGGTRGFSGEVPTNWGIGLMTVHSAPQSATN